MTARVKASTVMRTFEERVILKAHQEQTVVLELQARTRLTLILYREQHDFNPTCCTHGRTWSSIAPIKAPGTRRGLTYFSHDQKTDNGHHVAFRVKVVRELERFLNRVEM